MHSTMIWVEKVAAAFAKSTRSETAFSTQNPLISLLYPSRSQIALFCLSGEPQFVTEGIIKPALKMAKDVGKD